MYMLPVAVARSSSNDNAICYVLPVLFMTSCFPIMPHTVYRDSTFPRYLNLIRQREPALFTVYCEETADCVNQCYCCCHLRERLCDRGRSLLSSVALLCDYFAFASALHRTFSSRNWKRNDEHHQAPLWRFCDFGTPKCQDLLTCLLTYLRI